MLGSTYKRVKKYNERTRNLLDDMIEIDVARSVFHKYTGEHNKEMKRISAQKEAERLNMLLERYKVIARYKQNVRQQLATGFDKFLSKLFGEDI